MNIKSFKSKKKAFEYVEGLFKSFGKILIAGSSVNKSLKKFSDIDVEIYTSKPKKPYYEIVLVNKKPILISVYFYKSKKKSSKEKYSGPQKIKRECQLAVDFLFKYLRSNNKKYLESVQRRIR